MQVLPQRLRWQSQVDVKRPEVAVAGTDFIKSHLVNNLLQRSHLVRHQRHAPFPVVNSSRAGDELGNAPGKLAPDPGVAPHQLLRVAKSSRYQLSASWRRLLMG